VSTKDGSAEIFELNDARMRLRDGDLEPGGYLSAGAYLAAVRETQGHSLQEISERTHIKTEYLEAIEQNNQDTMPSRPFAIGFVKVYAETLGLDAAPIVSRFKEDAGFSAAANVEDIAEVAADMPKAPMTERSDMSLFAVLAVLVFILWCAFQITQPRNTTTPYRLDGLPAALAPVVTEASPQNVSIEEPSSGVAAPELPVIVEAKLIEQLSPVYPVRCEAGAAPQETVDVAFTVTAQGGVASERVVNSSNGCFDRTSLNAVRRWRYEPRTVDGVPGPAFEQRVVFPFNRPQ